MTIEIQLREHRDITPRKKMGKVYRFDFKLLEAQYRDSPEWQQHVRNVEIDIEITHVLQVEWRIVTPDRTSKVAYWYALKTLEEKINDGTLSDHHELVMHSRNYGATTPPDISKIPNFNKPIKISRMDSQLMQDSSLLELASKIIDTRDNVNALFNAKHNQRLLTLVEERDLLQLFRIANSEEEFFYRVCALNNLACDLNNDVLREITGIRDKGKRSLDLLETYLKTLTGFDKTIIDTLRNIARIRKSYPVHTDRAGGVLEAYTYFGLQYPITNHNKAWSTLLLGYLDSLSKLKDILR